MGVIRHIGPRDSKATIAKRAAVCEVRLKKALRLASGRAVRSSSIIRELFRSAVVEGLAPGQKMKAGVIRFSAPPFQGGLHQIWGWHQVEARTDSEVASTISAALRLSLLEKRSNASR